MATVKQFEDPHFMAEVPLEELKKEQPPGQYAMNCGIEKTRSRRF